MANDPLVPVWHDPGMANRLRALRKERGWTLEQVAAKLGATHTTIARLEKGERRLDDKWLTRLATVYGCSKSELLDGQQTVRVVGYVGAGAEIHMFPGDASTEDLDEVEAPPGADEFTVAVIVEGDSMFPRYLDHETIYYRRGDSQREAISLIGRDVVARTADGKTYVKLLRRGSVPGLFTLDSYNAPPMEDVALEWVVPVKWVKRD